MSNYGRNFEFRVQPAQGQRASRYIIPATGTPIPMGAPVVVDVSAGNDVKGRLQLGEASGAAKPQSGTAGIPVYEYTYDAFSGFDPVLTNYSDFGVVPVDRGCYLVSGDQVKIVLRNTVDHEFYSSGRTYTGRKMVAGLGATPTVAVGDYLRPHDTPSDSNGYWQETSTASDAWLVIEKVDTDRLEVEARFLF